MRALGCVNIASCLTHLDLREHLFAYKCSCHLIFQEGVLLACFSDLRQILDLFVSWDWSSYLADYGNPRSKYVRVKPEDALLLLDKLKESENRNMFSGMLNKKDRDKRRLVDTVYKQLKALAQPGT